MRFTAFVLAAGLGMLAAAHARLAPGKAPVRPNAAERTSFQTGAKWDPAIQIGSDVAMCYGIDASIGDRVAQWKAQGYIPQVMTGVAWGEYQDFLYGRFDGVNHVDEAQTDRNGNVIGHGRDVYYMCPSENYGKFLSVGVKRAIDAGAEAIYLEEPEFWVRAGYSAGFKREWKAYYKEEWQPPHSSPDAQFRASQLKYYLYRRALKQIFDFVHAYNKQTGKHVRCYVPTHSLINYAHWNIVSPESSLMQVGADGYIAQTWMGTARTPNMYQGELRERTFETAFLEYGAMMNVVRATKGRVWFLNDPIEDNPDHSWTDYRTNWESTLTASLLWPQVANYEVMPWPERIFNGKYPTVDRSQRKPGEPVERVPIPAAYGTELMSVLNALNDMEQKNIKWDCGTQGIGVVVSDTMMFQRGEPSHSDEHLGSFYGLALPLVKHGMPAEPVQLENATIPNALAPYKILLLTYEGMKPMAPDVHTALAKWVRAGGVLIIADDGSDPYNSVRSWWNTAPNQYKTPLRHLFDTLGKPDKTIPIRLTTGEPEGMGGRPLKETTESRYGKGTVYLYPLSPASLTGRKDGGEIVRAWTKKACQAAKTAYRETNYLVLRRGPYVVAAGLDESLPTAPHVLRGHFLDLFDADLPIRDSITLTPGSRHLLVDLDAMPGKQPQVLAGACRITDVRSTPTGLRFHAVAPDRINAAVRIRLPEPATSVHLDGSPLPTDAQQWDASTRTLLIRFPNAAHGHDIQID